MGNIYFNLGTKQKEKYKIDFLPGNIANITRLKTGKSVNIAYNKNTKIHRFISVINWYELNNWL